MSNLTLSMPTPMADLNGYLQSVQRFPYLSEEEERRLAEEFRSTSSVDAAWALVTSHLRYVVKLARGYRGYGLPEEDLIQEGNIGLMKAVKRFDPGLGVRLSAFAVHWIRAEIHEFVLRNWRIVKVATTKAQRKLFFNLRGAKRSLGRLGREEAQRIAEDLDVKVGDVLEMDTRLGNADVSFEPADHDDDTWAPVDWLEHGVVDPEEAVAAQEQASTERAGLHTAIATLDPRSREIIAQRWLKEPKAPLRELAEQFGVSIERIRQIESHAITTLRRAVEAPSIRP